MCKLRNIAKAKGASPSFNGVCGTKDTIDRIIIDFSLRHAKQATFHNIETFEAFFEEYAMKLGDVDAHMINPRLFSPLLTAVQD